MMRIKPLLFGLSFFLLMGCDQSYEASKQQRMKLASSSSHNKQQPVVIGVPWTTAADDEFINGVKLAVKKINQKGGVLENSPLQIIIKDTESAYSDSSLSQGARRDVILDIAKSYAANPNLIAVIGHSSSETSMIASVVYQNRGILFLSPNARYGKLTGHNFTYTFRTSLNNAIMGGQLAAFAAQKGYKRIAVLFSRTDSTNEFINEFTTYAIENYHIEIVYRRSFFERNVDIISLIAELKSIQNVDAICIATGGKKAAEIYQQIRNVGIKLPIIGNATLDTKEFADRVKQWEYSKKIQKSYIPTLFTSDASEGKQFDRLFQQEYGKEADYLAALGYDAVNLLAHAIQYAKSKVPIEIATTLRYMEACKGVSGKYEFELNGDLKTKPVSFYHMEKNQYVFELVNKNSVIDDPNLEACNEVDRDHDGIPTSSDQCPNSTPAEIVKGVYQDGPERGCPIDSDNDGIPNYKDECPNDTQAAISKGVGAHGCPVDFDKDGIPDYKDQDVDGDKVSNGEDHCPKSTVKELVYGANLKGKQAGCPLDSDADSVPDYLDACRNNTQVEISQGVDAAGCPVDRDFDGVLDYQDKCLKTPEDLLVDKEGCEVISATTSLKSAKLLFASKQSDLTEAGSKYLDELLSHSNLPLLKKVEIIGYATHQDKEIFQTRLQNIAAYFQQKKIPLEKIENTVKESLATKNNAVEFIFSEVKLNPDADESSVKPEESGTTKTPVKPEPDAPVNPESDMDNKTPAKLGFGAHETPDNPKSGALVPTSQRETGMDKNPSKPNNAATPTTRPLH